MLEWFRTAENPSEEQTAAIDRNEMNPMPFLWAIVLIIDCSAANLQQEGGEEKEAWKWNEQMLFGQVTKIWPCQQCCRRYLPKSTSLTADSSSNKIIHQTNLTFLTNQQTFPFLFSLRKCNNYNLMKKKVEQKKEIVPIMQPGLFWEYKQYPQESLDKIDAFLTTFANELKALVLPDRPLEDNYEALCQKMGLNPHPSLSKKPAEVSQFPSLKNTDYGEKYAVFMNHKIDAATLKLFSFLIGIYRISSLKISNNNLENELEEVRKLIQKEDQLTTLYFEWNPLLDHPKRRQLFLGCARPSLQHLILRECKMGNAIVKDLLKKLKQNADSRLKSLDLYGNDITPDLTHQICEFVEENKTIEFLGLSKNALGSEDFLKRLFSAIGQVPLSEQEYEQHKLKEKARDEIVEKNKKRKKGSPEEAVPFLLEVKDTPNGKVFVKNTTLKILNLASNCIKDNCAALVRKLVEGNGKQLELFIEGNKFSKTVKETFKFYENVIS